MNRILVLATAVLTTLVFAPVAGAATVSRVFGGTSAEQTFTPPEGVNRVHIALVGAPGGAGAGGAVGGVAQVATGDLNVAGGSRLYVEVGGAGTAGSNAAGFAGGAGGFNGGGAGGLGCAANGAGGGGGGATDVRLASMSSSEPGDTREIVASGGGGGGGGTTGGAGGPGDGQGGNSGGGLGGGPASTTAGGAGGPPNGQAGFFATGGEGATAGCPSSLPGGGGGGGGYYGGGSGALGPSGGGGGGGGGGSTLFGDPVQNPVPALNTTGLPPQVSLSYTAPLTLTVTVGGTGAGTVTSSDRISCPGKCTTSLAPGAQIILIAKPGAGATFAGWTGCTSASGTTCTVTVNSDHTVAAKFSGPGTAAKPPPKLALTKFAFAKGKASFKLSRSAKVKLLFTKKKAGRKVRGKCKAGAKKGKKCTVYAAVKTTRVTGKAGANKVKLPKLKKGTYVVFVSSASGKSRTKAVKHTLKVK
jgi:Divergent InlB B-repeat domain/Glycine rich protein